MVNWFEQPSSKVYEIAADRNPRHGAISYGAATDGDPAKPVMALNMTNVINAVTMEHFMSLDCSGSRRL